MRSPFHGHSSFTAGRLTWKSSRSSRLSPQPLMSSWFSLGMAFRWFILGWSRDAGEREELKVCRALEEGETLGTDRAAVKVDQGQSGEGLQLPKPGAAHGCAPGTVRPGSEGPSRRQDPRRSPGGRQGVGSPGSTGSSSGRGQRR